MIIGERLRVVREEKKFSQGDVERRTGLLRCYISRVENGHTVPAVETLEKFARALEVPMYQLFYDGEEPPKLPNLPKRKTANDILWGSKGKDARLLAQFCRLFSRMDNGDLEWCCSWHRRWQSGRQCEIIVVEDKLAAI
jgi:transcriptional regulator with XRE-family HTH domain